MKKKKGLDHDLLAHVSNFRCNLDKDRPEYSRRRNWRLSPFLININWVFPKGRTWGFAKKNSSTGFNKKNLVTYPLKSKDPRIPKELNVFLLCFWLDDLSFVEIWWEVEFCSRLELPSTLDIFFWCATEAPISCFYFFFFF